MFAFGAAPIDAEHGLSFFPHGSRKCESRLRQFVNFERAFSFCLKQIHSPWSTGPCKSTHRRPRSHLGADQLRHKDKPVKDCSRKACIRSSNVRIGSQADIRADKRDVRFYPHQRTCSSSASMSVLCQKRTLRSSALRSRWLLNARIRHRDHESSRKTYGYDEARPPAHGGTAVST